MNSQVFELTRTEEALMREASVLDCAVRLRAGDGETTRVIAYVVAGTGFREAEVRARLLGTSPVQPDYFVQLSALPISEDGMVDEQALAALPVMDEEFLLRYQEQLLAIPGVA